MSPAWGVGQTIENMSMNSKDKEDAFLTAVDGFIKMVYSGKFVRESHAWSYKGWLAVVVNTPTDKLLIVNKEEGLCVVTLQSRGKIYNTPVFHLESREVSLICTPTWIDGSNFRMGVLDKNELGIEKNPKLVGYIGEAACFHAEYQDDTEVLLILQKGAEKIPGTNLEGKTVTLKHHGRIQATYTVNDGWVKITEVPVKKMDGMAFAKWAKENWDKILIQLRYRPIEVWADFEGIQYTTKNRAEAINAIRELLGESIANATMAYSSDSPQILVKFGGLVKA